MEDNYSKLQGSIAVIDKAFEMCQKEYSQEEIECILKGCDDVKKCIAIMNIETIPSQEFANLLISHLTNQGGTVREAVAIKLDILFEENKIEYFQDDNTVNTICNAIIDINPNISRLILGFINKIDNKNLICENIFYKIQNSLDNIYKSDVLQNHQINKYYFKIYWLLEALYYLENIDITKFYPQFECIVDLPEYTVREKLGYIVKKYNFEKLKTKLANDDNYYVRKIFNP